MQVIGGAKLTVKDGKLVDVLVGGEPLDDNRVYGVATIDFLLDGGDNLHIGRGAVSLQILDKNVIDVMMPYVKSLTAEGKDIVYQKDGRVEILK
ncbi:MAG: 5'-nucleotidase C-terminal domain-containing protein, partial [Bacteroidales bacterium]|nr:5'-nucleotidase C-terminal domain-containing protein [Bacteroidales bacterium]